MLIEQKEIKVRKEVYKQKLFITDKIYKYEVLYFVPYIHIINLPKQI